MSGNADKTKPSESEKNTLKMDRRISRTRDTLGDALVELIHEKTFDEITVQDVLDRAGVGRSTFYAHYRDKQDLFLSDVEDFLELMSGLLTRHNVSLKRVAPVAELFAHISDAKDFYSALVSSGKVNDVLELGRGYFARSIEDRLRMANVGIGDDERKAVAFGLSGNLFALLEWWIDHGMIQSPRDMDTLFHRMVWNGLEGRTDSKT
jgi:AcrR family transcriptional regulator